MRATLIALAVLFSTTLADAAPVLKFDDPTAPGGTVSWSGAGPITGTDIQFQSILGLATPLNAGVVLDCVGCLLNFQTGAATAATTPTGTTLITADPGTAITIVGAVPAIGLGAGTILLSGTFSGNPLEAIGAGGEFGLFLGAGPDVKDATLAGFFGLDPLSFTFGTTSIQSILDLDPVTHAFTGVVVNADLNNTAVVPNPMSLLLVGLGLGVMGLVRRMA